MTEETVLQFVGAREEPSSALHKRMQMVLMLNGMMTRALMALNVEVSEVAAPLVEIHAQLDREIEALAQEIAAQSL